ncbi:MAG: tRNA (guanosine(46)-N7)-methyltransferase TrmB [Phycisphaerales bacterium]
MSFGISRGRELDIDGWGLNHDDLPPLPAPGEAPNFDPRDWFEHPERRFELEIGAGKGTFLVQQAVLEPDTNFLGVEHAGEFTRFAADRARRHQLANVRMLHADAVEVIRWRMKPAVAAVIHLYFSDPWPKARHHKRRVVQDETLPQFHRILQPEGELRIVTDHDDLWEWYVEHAARAVDAGLFTREAFVRPASAGEGELVGTNFERKFKVEGRNFRAMTLKRVGN